MLEKKYFMKHFWGPFINIDGYFLNIYFINTAAKSAPTPFNLPLVVCYRIHMKVIYTVYIDIIIYSLYISFRNYHGGNTRPSGLCNSNYNLLFSQT